MLMIGLIVVYVSPERFSIANNLWSQVEDVWDGVRWIGINYSTMKVYLALVTTLSRNN